MTPVFVDSNVILDLTTEDPRWMAWSRDSLTRLAEESVLVINAIVFAEVSADFVSVEDVGEVLPPAVFRREPIPFDAAFLAEKAYLRYRRQGGSRLTTLPGFFIGAHAAVAGYRLLTRDASRYRTYFPTVELIAPD